MQVLATLLMIQCHLTEGMQSEIDLIHKENSLEGVLDIYLLSTIINFLTVGKTKTFTCQAIHKIVLIPLLGEGGELEKRNLSFKAWQTSPVTEMRRTVRILKRYIISLTRVFLKQTAPLEAAKAIWRRWFLAKAPRLIRNQSTWAPLHIWSKGLYILIHLSSHLILRTRILVVPHRSCFHCILRAKILLLSMW